MHVYPRAEISYNIHFVITALFTMPSFVEATGRGKREPDCLYTKLPAGQSESCLFKKSHCRLQGGYGVSPLSKCLVYIPFLNHTKLYTSRALGDFPQERVAS